MYASICARMLTYDVRLDAHVTAYQERVLALPMVVERLNAAKTEADDIDGIEVEFRVMGLVALLAHGESFPKPPSHTNSPAWRAPSLDHRRGASMQICFQSRRLRTNATMSSRNSCSDASLRFFCASLA
jgi:hypothetical protein